MLLFDLVFDMTNHIYSCHFMMVPCYARPISHRNTLKQESLTQYTNTLNIAVFGEHTYELKSKFILVRYFTENVIKVSHPIWV